MEEVLMDEGVVLHRDNESVSRCDDNQVLLRYRCPSEAVIVTLTYCDLSELLIEL